MVRVAMGEARPRAAWASSARRSRVAIADDPTEYANAPQPTRARKLTVRLSTRCAFSRRIRSIRAIPTLIQNSPQSQVNRAHDRGGERGEKMARAGGQ